MKAFVYRTSQQLTRFTVSQSMYPFLPADSLAVALELVCCFATAITAIVSYLFALRV